MRKGVYEPHEALFEDLLLWHGPGHRWDAIMQMLDEGYTDREIRDRINEGVRYYDRATLNDIRVYRKVHDHKLEWGQLPFAQQRIDMTTLLELIHSH